VTEKIIVVEAQITKAWTDGTLTPSVIRAYRLLVKKLRNLSMVKVPSMGVVSGQ